MIGQDTISKWVATSAHSFGCDRKLFLVEGDFSSGARFHTPLVIIRVLWSFMNSAAAGGEVIRGGEADRSTATFDRDHALNISFSVRSLADDDGTISIFQAGCNDFASASGVFVDQHSDRQVSRYGGSGFSVDRLDLGHATALGSDD